MNRERFGTLLITAGLACAVWPALGWGYGLLSQKQLADEFSGTTPRRN